MPVLSNLIVRIGASTDDFDKKINASLGKMKRFASEVSQVGQSLSIGLSAPLIAVGTAALKAASDMQGLSNGLTATMKSTALAAAEMERLKEVARLPGIGLEDAVKGSIRLQILGTSADESRRIMMELGNALATVGGGREDFAEVIRQLSQLGATGKVTKENLDPIIERIPQIAAIIKERFGAAALGDPAKTFEKLGISSQQFIRIVTDELAKGERAAGGMKNSFENLRDAAKQTAAAFGESLKPAAEFVLKEFLIPGVDKAKSMADAFNTLDDGTKKLAVSMAALGAAIPLALVAFGTVAEKALAAGQAALKVWAVLGKIGAAAGTTAGGLVGLAAGFVGISAAVGGLLYPLLGTKTATENLDKAAKDSKATMDALSKTYRDNLVAQGQLDASTTSAYDGLLNYTRGLKQTQKAVEAATPPVKAAKQAVDELANAYTRLGITNTTDAIGSFVLARRAVEQVQAAYEAKKASSVDLQRAIEALGQEYLKLIDGLGAIRPKTLEVADSFDFARERAMMAIGDIQLAAASARNLDLGQLIMTGEPRRDDGALAGAEQARAAKRNADMIKILSGNAAGDWKKTQQAISRQVSTIVTDLSRGLADIIVSGGKVGQKFEELGKQIAKSLVRTIIENGINKVIGALGGLMANLGGVGGALGGLLGGTGARTATSAIPGVLGGGANAAMGAIPGISSAAGSASSGIGSAVAAANPVTAVVNAVAGVATAVSSIISNFQFSAMNKTLDLIEKEVRYSQIHLLHLLEKNNEYLPKLKDIWDSLIRMETRQMGLTGGGGAVTINISTTGDTRQLLDALTRELKLLGVIPQ
jgi:tape measure domain-containing protein